MRATKIIYRRELGAYLRSPLGWIIAAAALLIAGILFQWMAMSGERLSADALAQFFWGTSGVVIGLGILLSFRLLAEERQNHTMILLKTSPISDVEIVVGKFLAAATFLAFVLALSIYMPLLIKVNGKITWSQLFVGYLGLWLLGCTVLAMGTFASALTRQQIIAALIGLLISIVFVLMYPLSKKLDAPVSTVLSLTDMWWVHFHEGFERSILNLKDVVYYIATTYFFLLLAVKTLETKRWQ
jgi:gliding motility-associated transport system permease protein